MDIQLCNISARIYPTKDFQDIVFQPTGTSESNLTPLETLIGEDNGIIKSNCGKRVAYLNNKTHMALRKVSSDNDVSYTALINAETLRSALKAADEAQNRRKRDATASIHPCSLDLLVFCAKHLADSVARTMAKYMLFLQHPHWYTYTHTYENPQYLDIPGTNFCAGSILPALSKEVMEAYASSERQQGERTGEGNHSDPSCLLDNLPIPEGIQAVEIDHRIKTELFMSVFSAQYHSTLLMFPSSHQRKGVDFISRRERLDLPQSDLWRRDTSKSSSGDHM